MILWNETDFFCTQSIPEDAIYEQLKALTDEETAVSIKELISSQGEKDSVVTKVRLQTDFDEFSYTICWY